MKVETLIRASGASSLLGGLMLAVFVIAHEPGTTDLGLGNVFWHTTESMALTFINLGLVGMYARLREDSGWLGLTGFVIAFIGGGWFAAAGYSEGYGVLRDPPFFVYAVRLAWSVFFLGWILFGLAILRTGLLPRSGAILCMIAAPAGFVWAILGGQQGYLLALGTGIVFGIGQMWLGIGLLRSH